MAAYLDPWGRDPYGYPRGTTSQEEYLREMHRHAQTQRLSFDRVSPPEQDQKVLEQKETINKRNKLLLLEKI